MPKISDNFKKHAETDVMIGKQIRRLRTLKGYSQAAIAKEIGVTFQQFQKYECGVNRLCVSRLLDICKFCKVSPSYFFDSLDKERECDTLYDSENSIEFEHENEHNKELLVLVRAFKAITQDSVRSKVLSLVKTMSQAYAEKSPSQEEMSEM
ncbi:helix-turn-helix family protein [Neorickettsia helminthoeca str. Oregon]|uniref:Helix-turn-helix family protein n=1 Tax=Neorickettsia helminthoeca str. Oregon TaxID=1286528 RepID=X5H3N8_9RICK|nr:helix-turn-helix transcriptional regulator [Neorickettsia helminthoeca]AHX11176.1 helix-turn-helix family protein [Neorickettsia helminthoeca str. Oregon]